MSGSVRRKALAEHAVSEWEKYYDDQGKGVWTSDRKRHRVRESIWLALAYFELDVQGQRANDLVLHVLKTQELNSNDRNRKYNFKWYYDQTSVSDFNGISFVGPVLARIFTQHFHQLRDDVVQPLRTALENGKLCVQHLLTSQIPVNYTNVYINLIGYFIMVGDEDKAHPYVDRLYKMIVAGGISEYCSWAYLAVQISGFQIAYAYAKGPEIKEKLRKLVEFHWYDCVHHYHLTSGMLSAVAARAKDLYGMDPAYHVQAMMYLYFNAGTLNDLASPSVEMLLSDYQPIDNVRKILENKRTLRYQAAYTRVDVSVYQTPHYSLSTQTGRLTQFAYTDVSEPSRKEAGHETTEHDIQLVYANGDKRYRGIKFHTFDVDYKKDDFNHHWVTAVQSCNKAVVSYSFDPQGVSDQRIYSEGCLGLLETTLAPGGDYSNFRINGSVWDGEDQALAVTDVITYKAGEAFIGISFLQTDVIFINSHPLCTAARPITLTTEKTSGSTHRVWLRSFLAYSTTTYHFVEKGRRLGYVIEMAGLSDYPSIQQFTEHVLRQKVEQRLENGMHEVILFSGTDTLYLKEDLSHNRPVYRRANGVEFDNHYLLKSNYVSLQIGEDLGDIKVDTEGQLPYRNTPSALTLEIAAEDMIIEAPMTCGPFLGAYRNAIYASETRKGSAGAILDIPQDDSWYVWARVFWKNAESNSFIIRINNDFRYPGDLLTDDEFYQFHWLRIARPYQLYRGRHTLRVDAREHGSLLDRIIVTNDPTFHPAQWTGHS